MVWPPWSQWMMWWAWHITGGRVQPGNAQWVSRRIRAIQMARGDQSSGSADVEGFAVAVEDGGDDLGVTGQPADGRGGQFGAVAGHPEAGHREHAGDRVLGEPGLELLEGGGDHEPGPGAVRLRWQVRVQGVLGGGDQGVPQPGAMITQILVSSGTVPGPLPVGVVGVVAVALAVGVVGVVAG
ncbi:MAG TPA: hypothetical protein VFQ01_01085, partial [Nocardioides sp.]|nr:hypothetical protein [Nocardioides sp.]